MRVALYTSGDIGGGHLARALAIARGLKRANVKAEYRVFYARLPMTPPWELDVTSLDVPRDTLSDPLKAPECDTARALSEFAPDVLLVDIAWFDLRHILPLANTEVWLLLRWCHPEILRGPFNRVFNDAHYARIVGIEPILPFEVREHIEPVVVTNPEECLPASALREHYGVPDGIPVTLIAQAGLPGERELLIDREERRRDGHHLIVSTTEDRDLFPIAPWLHGADRIAGGAGYNLYWETRWLGLSARTDLQAFRRRIDDQTPRMRLAKDHMMRENGADTLVRWLAGRG